MTCINCGDYWVRDMNIDKEIIDYLPVPGAVRTTGRIYGNMTVTFGYVA